MAATSGMQTPHQIVSEMLKDQTAREMLQEFFGDMMAAQVSALRTFFYHWPSCSKAD